MAKKDQYGSERSQDPKNTSEELKKSFEDLSDVIKDLEKDLLKAFDYNRLDKFVDSLTEGVKEFDKVSTYTEDIQKNLLGVDKSINKLSKNFGSLKSDVSDAFKSIPKSISMGIDLNTKNLQTQLKSIPDIVTIHLKADTSELQKQLKSIPKSTTIELNADTKKLQSEINKIQNIESSVKYNVEDIDTPKIKDINKTIKYNVQDIETPKVKDIQSNVKYNVQDIPTPEVNDINASINYSLGNMPKQPNIKDIDAAINYQTNIPKQPKVEDIQSNVKLNTESLSDLGKISDIELTAQITSVDATLIDKTIYDKYTPVIISSIIDAPDTSLVNKATKKVKVQEPKKVAETIQPGPIVPDFTDNLTIINDSVKATKNLGKETAAWVSTSEEWSKVAEENNKNQKSNADETSKITNKAAKEAEHQAKILKDQLDLQYKNKIITKEQYDAGIAGVKTLQDQSKELSKKLKVDEQIADLSKEYYAAQAIGLGSLFKQRYAQEAMTKAVGRTTSAYKDLNDISEAISNSSGSVNHQQSLERIKDIINDTVSAEQTLGQKRKELAEASRTIGTNEYSRVDVSKQIFDTKQRELSLEQELSNLAADKSIIDAAEREAKEGLIKNQIKLNQAQLAELEILNKKSESYDKIISKASGLADTLSTPIDKIFGLVPGGLSKMLGLDIVQKDLKEKLTKNITQAFASGGNSAVGFFKAVGAGFGSILSMLPKLIGMLLVIGPIVAAIAGITALVNLFIGADKEVTQLAKDLNITKQEAFGVKDAAVAISQEMNILGITSKEVAEMMTELKAATGLNYGLLAQTNDAAKDFLQTAVGLKSAFGLSADETAGLAKAAAMAGGSVEDIAISAEKFGDEIVGSAQIMKDIAKLSARALQNFAKTPAHLAAAAKQARMMGTTLDQVNSNMEQSLDFFGQMEASFYASAYLGRQLDTTMLSYYANIKDGTNYLKEQKRLLPTLEEYTNLTAFGQQKLAQALGMSADQLAEMMAYKKQLAVMGISEEEMERKFTKLQQGELNMAQELNNLTSDEARATFKQIMAERQRLNMQEKLAAMMSKLTDAMYKVVGPLIEPFEKMLDSIFGSEEATKQLVSKLQSAGATVVDIAKKGLPVALDLLKGMYSVASFIYDIFKGIGSFIKGLGLDFGGILSIAKIIGGVIVGWYAYKGLSSLIGGFKEIYKSVTGISKMIGDSGMFGGKKVQAPETPKIPEAPKTPAAPDTGSIDQAKKVGGLNANDLIKGAAALLIVAAALYVAAKAFQEFADVSWQDVALGLGGITGLALVTKLLGKSSTETIKGAAAVALLGAALIPFAYAMSLVADLDIQSVLAAAAGLVIFTAAIFGLGALVSGPQAGLLLAGMATLAGIGLAMSLFGEGMKEAAPIIEAGGKAIASVFEGVGKAIGSIIESVGKAISTIMTTLADSIVKLGKIDPTNILKLGGALAALGVGLLALTAGEVVSGIASFFGASPVDTLKELETINGNKMKTTGNGLESIATSLTKFGAIDVDPIQKVSDVLASFNEDVIESIDFDDIDSLSSSINTLSQSLAELSNSMSKLGDTEIQKLKDLSSVIPKNTSIFSVENISKGFKSVKKSITESLKSGFDDAYKAVSDWFGRSPSKVGLSIDKGISSVSGNISDSLTTPFNKDGLKAISKYNKAAGNISGPNIQMDTKGVSGFTGISNTINQINIAGLQKSLTEINSAFDKLDLEKIKQFTEIFSKSMNDVIFNLTDSLSLLISGLSGTTAKSLPALEDVFEDIEDAFDELDFENIESFTKTISSSFTAATSIFSTSMKNFVNAFNTKRFEEQLTNWKSSLQFITDTLKSMDFSGVKQFSDLLKINLKVASENLIAGIRSLSDSDPDMVNLKSLSFTAFGDSLETLGKEVIKQKSRVGRLKAIIDMLASIGQLANANMSGAAYNFKKAVDELSSIGKNANLVDKFAEVMRRFGQGLTDVNFGTVMDAFVKLGKSGDTDIRTAVVRLTDGLNALTWLDPNINLDGFKRAMQVLDETFGRADAEGVGGFDFGKLEKFANLSKATLVGAARNLIKGLEELSRISTDIDLEPAKRAVQSFSNVIGSLGDFSKFAAIGGSTQVDAAGRVSYDMGYKLASSASRIVDSITILYNGLTDEMFKFTDDPDMEKRKKSLKFKMQKVGEVFNVFASGGLKAFAEMGEGTESKLKVAAVRFVDGITSLHNMLDDEGQNLNFDAIKNVFVKVADAFVADPNVARVWPALKEFGLLADAKLVGSAQALKAGLNELSGIQFEFRMDADDIVAITNVGNALEAIADLDDGSIANFASDINALVRALQGLAAYSGTRLGPGVIPSLGPAAAPAPRVRPPLAPTSPTPTTPMSVNAGPPSAESFADAAKERQKAEDQKKKAEIERKSKWGRFTGAKYARGGFTGAGSKYEPAGTVHKGEYVFNQDKTKKFYPLFDQIQKGNIKPHEVGKDHSSKHEEHGIVHHLAEKSGVEGVVKTGEHGLEHALGTKAGSKIFGKVLGGAVKAEENWASYVASTALQSGEGYIGKGLLSGETNILGSLLGGGAGSKLLSMGARFTGEGLKTAAKSNVLGSVLGGLIDTGINIYKGKDWGESLGRAAISGVGGFLGGTLGSLVLPGAGTIAGSIGGSLLADQFSNWLFGDKKEEKKKGYAQGGLVTDYGAETSIWDLIKNTSKSIGSNAVDYFSKLTDIKPVEKLKEEGKTKIAEKSLEKGESELLKAAEKKLLVKGEESVIRKYLGTSIGSAFKYGSEAEEVLMGLGKSGITEGGGLLSGLLKSGVGAGARFSMEGLKAASKSNVLGTVLGGAIDLGTKMYEGKDFGDSLARTLISGTTGFLGGTLGSLVLPGAGTVAGSIGGSMLGDTLADWLLGPAEEEGDDRKFATGGYTGDGETLEKAGTVHKGEFVFDNEMTKRYRTLFEGMQAGQIKPIQADPLTVNASQTTPGGAIAAGAPASSTTQNSQQLQAINQTLQAILAAIDQPTYIKMGNQTVEALEKTLSVRRTFNIGPATNII